MTPERERGNAFVAMKAWAFAWAIACGACSSKSAVPDAGVDAEMIDAPDEGDASADVAPDVDKSLTCASTFGSALTSAFGRLDGTVLAVLPPNDQACALPNSTHMIIQVAMQGAAYRMVVDVLSSFGDPNVLFDELDAPLPGETWAEGWHTDVPLDYVTTLSVHSGAFTSMTQADVVAKITSEIDLGAHISVFATSAGEPDSAHLVHRNLTNADGAIVIHPESAMPHFMLIRFAEQSF